MIGLTRISFPSVTPPGQPAFGVIIMTNLKPIEGTAIVPMTKHISTLAEEIYEQTLEDLGSEVCWVGKRTDNLKTGQSILSHVVLQNNGVKAAVEEIQVDNKSHTVVSLGIATNSVPRNLGELSLSKSLDAVLRGEPDQI
jgi:hypothetical protein